MHDKCPGRRNLVPGQQFGQIDLVGTAGDGGGVVNHRQSFPFGPLGKPVREMVDDQWLHE